jgi:hypothetical protein
MPISLDSTAAIVELIDKDELALLRPRMIVELLYSGTTTLSRLERRYGYSRKKWIERGEYADWHPQSELLTSMYRKGG